MISKELLSVVLDIPLQHIRYNGTTNHYKIFKENLFNWNSGDYGRWSNLEINIYELAHKCKEWALKHHYKVISKPDNVPGLWEAYVNLSLTSKHGEVADTEPEAIFKACEWILTKDSK